MVVIHTVKGFGIVSKADVDVEVDVFLELLCFFSNATNVGKLISGSSTFSKPSLSIWKFMVHRLLKPGLGNFFFLIFYLLFIYLFLLNWVLVVACGI